MSENDYMSLQQQIFKAQDELKRVQKLNAELLAACKAAANELGIRGGDPRPVANAYDILLAAITAAEGE